MFYISVDILTPTFLSKSPTIFIADILAGGVSGMFCPPLGCCTVINSTSKFTTANMIPAIHARQFSYMLKYIKPSKRKYTG
jgi:hypothetical protein